MNNQWVLMVSVSQWSFLTLKLLMMQPIYVSAILSEGRYMFVFFFVIGTQVFYRGCHYDIEDVITKIKL